MAQRSTNLPVHLPSLIGREEAVASARQTLLDAERGLLTLTGTGGSGKTRLALAVATEVADWIGFTDGVWLAELAPLSDAALVPGAVAASVGVKEQSGRPIRETLLEHLRSRAQLLVLDNCEHLVAATAALADELLRNCPGLRILATSREPLRIPGERVRRVPPLPVPDARVMASLGELAKNPAVQLFVERAQAVQCTLTLTAETGPAIAGICARLGGLPLAIELAAARALVLTPDQILSRLDDTFRLLVGGSRTAPTRQQTLRACLDWSYDLLSSSERVCLERLAVFAGGFDLEAAEAIWSDDNVEAGPDALDMLTGLVDRSLVTVQSQHRGGVRYGLLEPVRQYAQEQLIERGSREATRTQHAAYFLRLVEQGEEGLKGPDAEEWKTRLELDHDNVRAVLRRSIDGGEPEIPLRIGSALRNFWQQFGYRNEGRRWLEEALTLGSDDVPSAIRGNAVLTAGMLAYSVGDYHGARARFEQAAEHWRSIGDRAGMSSTLGYQGRTVAATAETAAEYECGKALMQEAIALNRETGALWWTADAMLFLGISGWEHAELDFAVAILREAAAINAQLGDSHAQSHLLSQLGGVLRDQGDLVGGQRLIEQSLAEARAINCPGGAADALYFLAGLTRLRGDGFLATQQALECLTLLHRLSDTSQILRCVELLGSLACEHGLPERTIMLFSAAGVLRRNAGLPMPPILRPEYQRDLATARAAIGSDRCAVVWEEGSAMTVDQLVEYARQAVIVPSQPQPPLAYPLSQRDLARLTSREAEVLGLVAKGQSNKEIAAELVLSVRTVERHITNLYGKIDARGKADATAYAIRHGLV